MRKEKKIAALAVVFFLFILPITPVFAQETPKKVFARMDTDKDGKVTKRFGAVKQSLQHLKAQ